MNYLRIALNNAQFPFKYEERQVPALIAGMDTANRAPAAFTGAASNMDWNIPQVIHMENYLPTARGYVGTMYRLAIAPIRTDTGYPLEDGYRNKTQIFERGLGGWAGLCQLVASDTDAEFSISAEFAATGPTDIIPDTSQERFYLNSGGKIYIKLTCSNPTALNVCVAYSASGVSGTFSSVAVNVSSYTATASGYYVIYFRFPFGGTSVKVVSLLVYESSTLLIPASEVTTACSTTGGSKIPALVLGSSIYPKDVTNWIYAAGINLGFQIGTTSSAEVNGITYVLYPAASGVTYALKNTVSAASVALTMPVGHAGVTINSIASCSGYMLMASATTLYWSTPTVATDFLNYGSGYVTPSGLNGPITGMVPLAGGVLLFSEFNAVSVQYTNIPNSPFRFVPVPDSGGIRSLASCAGAESSQFAVAWTSRGFQTISITGAAKTLPELHDALTSNWLYQYGGAGELGLVKMQDIVGGLIINVNMISAKYVVVSYKLKYSAWYQHALVWDIQLNRWGHLRLNHTGVVSQESDLTMTAFDNTTNPRHMLAFLQPTGAVLTIDRVAVDINTPTIGTSNVLKNYYSSGITIGPISLTRGAKMTIQEVEVSNITYPEETKIYIKPAQQGLEVTAASKEFTFSQILGRTKKFLGRCTGESIEVTFKGIANMQNLVLGVTKHGN
jgi:hypothetical protein